ncbi:IS630 family transposase [Pseudomonas sp. FP603]|uniref:IS630 family transposase n=1 Tax=Pseudomonas TaxID=286 RepID=UPI00351E0667
MGHRGCAGSGKVFANSTLAKHHGDLPLSPQRRLRRVSVTPLPGTRSFTALDYLQGRLISSVERQHRHQAWLEFLKKINRETPKHLQLHLIVDNYATHKHPKVKAWLEKHKRFHMHFTATSSAWMNMVERFSRDITVYLRDGSFSSVRELESSITTFLALRNAQPTRYIWNAKGKDILNEIQRAREAMVLQA